jgi:predicted dinucleotide-binding enzyme
MRIGIIGAGNMGAALAAQLTQAGHQVVMAARRVLAPAARHPRLHH